MRRLSRFGVLLVVSFGLLLSLASGSAGAQVRVVESEAAMPETDLAGALSHLSLRAAFVFVGTVETIERKPGVVEVGLRVEQAIQGEPGSHYVLREWAGRWVPGLNRYTVGQRALFFLQATGAAGLSSPVDGGEGVVPVLGDASDLTLVPILDTRRLNTRLQRNVGDKLADETTMTLAKAVQVIAQAPTTGLRRPAKPSGDEPLPIMRGAVGAHSMAVAHGVR